MVNVVNFVLFSHTHACAHTCAHTHGAESSSPVTKQNRSNEPPHLTLTIWVPGRKAISSAAEPGVTQWMKMPVRFPPMTLICSSNASPWKASTVTWLRIFRAGLRRTGALLREGRRVTERGCGPEQAQVRPSPSRGPSGFSILEFFIPRPRHDPTSQQGQDTVLPLQLLGLAPPSAHLAER